MSLGDIVSEPVIAYALLGFLREPFRSRRRNNGNRKQSDEFFSMNNGDAQYNRPQDESVGDFISRRMGHKVADNLVSAIYHGIYAGDIYKLSAQTLLSPYWTYEDSPLGVVGSTLDRAYCGERHVPYDIARDVQSWQRERGPKHCQSMYDFSKGASTLAFKQGMAQFSAALESTLRRRNNVSINTESRIRRIFHRKGTSKAIVSRPPDLR